MESYTTTSFASTATTTVFLPSPTAPSSSAFFLNDELFVPPSPQPPLPLFSGCLATTPSGLESPFTPRFLLKQERRPEEEPDESAAAATTTTAASATSSLASAALDSLLFPFYTLDLPPPPPSLAPELNHPFFQGLAEEDLVLKDPPPTPPPPSSSQQAPADPAPPASASAAEPSSNRPPPIVVARPTVPVVRVLPPPAPQPAPVTTAAASAVSDFVDDPKRYWSEVSRNADLLRGQGLEVSVRCKNRHDEPCLSIPERLYSSHKYEFRISCRGSFVQNSNSSNSLQLLVATLALVEAKKLQEQPRDAQKGTTTTVCTRSSSSAAPTDELCGFLKVQLNRTHCCYHKNPIEYCWELRLSLNSAADGTGGGALIVMRSPSFRVYSRKPTADPGWTKRRNQAKQQTAPLVVAQPPAQQQQRLHHDVSDGDKSDADSLLQPPRKMARTDDGSSSISSSLFSEFCSKLEELVQLKERLAPEEQQHCIAHLMSKLSSMNADATPLSEAAASSFFSF